jgi:GAF domain-containing protein
LDADALLAEIARAPDAQAAMQRAVEQLKAQLPHYTWVGIYLLEGQELVLGPFLGKPSPHTRIPLNRGICGAAASQQQTIIVDGADLRSGVAYLASGSGLNWNLTTLLVVPFPVSMWNGERVLTVDQSPRPFQPPFGSSMRPSSHFV